MPHNPPRHQAAKPPAATQSEFDAHAVIVVPPSGPPYWVSSVAGQAFVCGVLGGNELEPPPSHFAGLLFSPELQLESPTTNSNRARVPAFHPVAFFKTGMSRDDLTIGILEQLVDQNIRRGSCRTLWLEVSDT